MPEKFYSVEEANALLPKLKPVLQRIRDTQEALARDKTVAAVREKAAAFSRTAATVLSRASASCVSRMRWSTGLSLGNSAFASSTL